MRYRLRTLFWVSAALAAAAGSVRHWYDVQMAPSRRDVAVLASSELRGATGRWEAGEGWGPLGCRRLTHLWCEEAEDLPRLASRLQEFTALESLQVLGRQIMPHAVAANSGVDDRVIAALRSHPSLQRILVDASVRGAPLGDEVALYTRDDLALLRAALPGMEIVWLEVH